VAGLCLVLAAGRAAAEPQGRDLYQQGLALYQAEKFPEAAEVFVRAYDLLRKPIILFNAAQANRKAGKFGEARRLYEQFLREASPADRESVGADAGRFITEIDEHFAEQRRLAEKGDAEEAAALAPPAARPVAVAPVARPTVRAPAPAKRTPVYKSWWLWTLVGVAAGAVAIGVGVGTTTNNDPATALGTRPLRFSLQF
jgi:tetratricopeptide (TPR) repeat protein